MVAQISAAALASENKSLAHPASVDSIPTAANQEDHVSMATFAARRLAEIVDNVRGIVAIELIAAAQALEFAGPHETSPLLARARRLVRERVAPFRSGSALCRGHRGDQGSDRCRAPSASSSRHPAELRRVAPVFLRQRSRRNRGEELRERIGAAAFGSLPAITAMANDSADSRGDRPGIGPCDSARAKVGDERRAAEQRAADDALPVFGQQSTVEQRTEERLPDDLDLAREEGPGAAASVPSRDR
jgi:hypothetical protein